jgi:hypothetical protein
VLIAFKPAVGVDDLHPVHLVRDWASRRRRGAAGRTGKSGGGQNGNEQQSTWDHAVLRGKQGL